MQKFKAFSSLTIGAMLFWGSCASDTPDPANGPSGYIVAKVKTDGKVHDGIPSTKAGAATIIPDPTDLAISLAKGDGSYSASWKSVNDFPIDQKFAVGAYTLEASFGSIETEGFDCPFYYGVCDFHVIEGETAEAEVTAKLANTMVSMEYTDAFKTYFKSYTGQLHATGGDFISMAADEARPAYLRPGQVTVTISIEKQNGVSANIEAASFEALPQHHYHITLDVNNGQMGESVLSVKFDDSIVTEDVEIDLSDSFLLAPAPTVNTKGFIDGQTISLSEGVRPDQASFVVSAPGGLKAVTLTTQSSELLSKGFPAEINLMDATAEQQAQLKSFGMDVKGLWNHPDKMAIIDMAGLIENLTATGTHNFALVAKDRLGKVNLPVTLNVATSSVDLAITDAPAIYLDATQATLKATYAGPDFADNVILETQNSAGEWQKTAYTVSTADNGYLLKFAVPSAYKDVPVRLLYNNKVKTTGNIHKYGVIITSQDADIWATHATVKVEKNAAIPYSQLKFYVATGAGEYSEISGYTIDESAHTVTFTNLAAGTAYSIKGSETSVYEPAYKACAITTEQALQPQNNTMEAWSRDGGWTRKSVGMGDTVYEYFPNSNTTENEYWATRNSLTTNKDFGYASMWYNYYSGVYGVNGRNGQAAEICTVGWSKTGANTFSGISSASSAVNHRTAGILFMGSYHYDKNSDTETFEYGRPFTSRPTALTFWYKFTPVSGESFKAYAVIENRNGGKVTELARGELVSGTQQQNFTQATINLKYTNKTLKATHAYIVFLSSTVWGLNDSPSVTKQQGSKGAFQGYADSRWTGNILDVDDILFTY